MKKTAALMFLLISCFISRSQTIQEIKRNIELEHYSKAQGICEKMKNTSAEAAYLLSEIHIEQGRLQEAKEVITASLQTFKGNTLIQVAEAHYMLCEGKKSEAKALFDRCIAGAGNDKADILIAVGRACAETPLRYIEPEYGITQLQEALKLQPSNGLIHIYIGDCYRHKIDVANAVVHYENALRMDKNLTAIAAYKMGNIYRAQGNCQMLTQSYTESVKADPQYMPAWRELYDAYASGDSKCYNAAKAETYYPSYIATAESGLQTELVKLQHQYYKKDYTGVLQTIKGIQAQMGQKAPASLYATAGMASYQQKDYAAAISSFENYFNTEKSAVNIRPYHYNTLASAYSEIGQYSKAKETYMKCAAMQTEDAGRIPALRKAAEEAAKAKDYQAEADISEQIIKGKQTVTSADYYRLGIAYYNAQDYNQSKKIFQRYAEAYPADWRPSLWIGNAEALLDSTMTTGAAIPHYEKFITLGKADPLAKNALVRTYMYLFAYEYQVKKNVPAAITHLESVLSLDPANADAQKYKKMLVK